MKNKKIKYAQSRLQRNILLASVFLFLAVTVWFDRSFHPYRKTAAPAQKAPQVNDVNDWDKYNEKSFIVIKAVDGDTIDINMPDGKFKDTRIRLLGVDTPETKDPRMGVMYFGPEASKFTTDTVLGQPVTVVMDKFSKPRDKYNRLLAFVRLADGRILNEELISQGFGYADTRFPHSNYEKYIELEKTAQEQKIGLWEKVTPDQMPRYKNQN